MNKYILRSTGNENVSINEVNSILKSAKGNIIDDSAFPKMLMVESELDLMEIADRNFKNEWKIFPEKYYEVPNMKVKIKK